MNTISTQDPELNFNNAIAEFEELIATDYSTIKSIIEIQQNKPEKMSKVQGNQIDADNFNRVVSPSKNKSDYMDLIELQNGGKVDEIQILSQNRFNEISKKLEIVQRDMQVAGELLTFVLQSEDVHRVAHRSISEIIRSPKNEVERSIKNTADIYLTADEKKLFQDNSKLKVSDMLDHILHRVEIEGQKLEEHIKIQENYKEKAEKNNNQQKREESYKSINLKDIFSTPFSVVEKLSEYLREKYIVNPEKSQEMKSMSSQNKQREDNKQEKSQQLFQEDEMPEFVKEIKKDDVKSNQEIYSHLIKEMKQDEAVKLENILSNSSHDMHCNTFQKASSRNGHSFSR